jgi:3-dehydrotetronate 4-kinase
MRLGVIADDMTGATDVALMITKAGMDTIQTIGVPDMARGLPEADAIVVALKSRNIAPHDAVARRVPRPPCWRRTADSLQVLLDV